MKAQHDNPKVAHHELQPAEQDGIHASTTEKEQLFLTMYSSLPWELRDYIHVYCVQGPYDNEVVVRHGTGSKLAFLVRQSIGARSYQWIEDPVLLHLSLDRIGSDVAREVLDAYYRTRTFKFAHRELGLLQTFLEADSFGLGMRPADHVRRVHLQIQPSLHTQLQGFKSKDKEVTKCCQALEALASIRKSRTTVTIHVDLAQEFFGDEEYENQVADAAELVFRIVKVIDTLKLDGLGIELVIEGEWDERTRLQLYNKSVTSLDGCTSQIKVACT